MLRHGDRPQVGAAAATVSPIASLIRTFQWQHEWFPSAARQRRARGRLNSSGVLRSMARNQKERPCELYTNVVVDWTSIRSVSRMRSDYQGWQDRRGNPALGDDDGGLVGMGRLAESPQDRTCGDGVERCVREAGVEYFGGRGIRSAAGERARSEDCARAQDGSEGQPVDRRLAPTRLVAQEFRATETGSRSARSDENSGHAGARPQLDLQSYSEGTGGCQHQVGCGGQRRVRS